MREDQYKVAMGGLLHDVGKLLHRCGDGHSHAQSGCELLRDRAGITEPQILQQVQYHHAAALKNAELPVDSLAYITCIANTMASAAERREEAELDDGGVRERALDSLFNILNGKSGKSRYEPGFLTEEIRNPTESPVQYRKTFYENCVEGVCSGLRGIAPGEEGINALLEVLETNLTYVPASAGRSEAADISLFDHCKLTAALGGCILEYLQESGISDYRAELLENADAFYAKQAFLLYSMDISGIQDFIYTITSEGALKALRARSFYLDLMMEHLVDELLAAVGLSRANCIYCGGGHAYLLLANTPETLRRVAECENACGEWLLKQFGTALYVAGSAEPCTANHFRNRPEGSYKALFAQVAAGISQKKLHRYTAGQIAALNSARADQELRECVVCHRTDNLDAGDKCRICAGLEALSGAILRQEFFAVTSTKDAHALLPLPFGRWLSAETEQGLCSRRKQDAGYCRSYCKSGARAGSRMAAPLWIGDYQNGETLQELAAASGGIRRLAVLRADVDNLGQAFVAGFESEKFGQRYVTLSRTANFSRKLALFFKRHINTILAQGRYFLTADDDPARKITVVYSGGDDLFVIGAWDDIVGFAVDLNNALADYSQGTLTISAGIGIYPEKYPVAAMARQTGELEEAAKGNPGKNSVAVFESGDVYTWQEFVEEVLNEKFALIRDFFSPMPGYGKSFLYHLLELMRARGEKINLARYAYLLSRMQPPEAAPEENKALYRRFSQKMYAWMRDEKQCRQAITAIYIYTYTIRESGEERK